MQFQPPIFGSELHFGPVKYVLG